MKLKVLVNEEVTHEWFEEMLKMENEIFPPEGNDYLSPEYVRNLYKENKEGLFFCIDEDEHKLAGYFTIIFISEEQKEQYLNGGHFSDLINIGMHKGKNIMYLYTAAFDEKYRGTKGMKLIGIEITKWLDKKESEGCVASETYSEAVSLDGVRTITKGFEMEPYHIDENGIGHYVSYDGMKKYREKMRNQ